MIIANDQTETISGPILKFNFGQNSLFAITMFSFTLSMASFNLFA